MFTMLCTGLMFVLLGSGITEACRGCSLFIAKNGAKQLVFEQLTAACDLQQEVLGSSRGVLTLEEGPDENVTISGSIAADERLHGLAVHEFGVPYVENSIPGPAGVGVVFIRAPNCAAIGRRYNPGGDLGILGKMKDPDNGDSTREVKITNSTLSLYGDRSIIGLSLVLYRLDPVDEAEQGDQDDAVPENQTSGNEGGQGDQSDNVAEQENPGNRRRRQAGQEEVRIACCNIHVVARGAPQVE